jgi:MYXO-CTERM domain-containing protein
MRRNSFAALIAAAAIATLAPTTASAQGTAGAGQGGTPGSGVGNGAIDLSYGNPQPQEEDGFPWGLLGLIGLAGLLGMRRDANGR